MTGQFSFSHFARWGPFRFPTSLRARGAATRRFPPALACGRRRSIGVSAPIPKFPLLCALRWIQKVLQRIQPRVFPLRRARTRRAIEVRAAFGAEALAILRAERLHRQRELELLAHQLFEIQRLVLVE